MYTRLTGMASYRWIIAIFFVVLILGCRAWGGIVSPKNGGALPDVHLRQLRLRKNAFTMKHGWIERARTARLHAHAALAAGAPRTGTDGGGALTGVLKIPAVLGLYGDTGEPPVTAGGLNTMLFEGSQFSRSVGEYYREVSRNLFDVQGDVYDWVDLDQPEGYYVGNFWGTDPNTSRTGEMIAEIVDALDPAIDFGAYDNDGPDGVPNSGDDDGFVDVLLVIHPTEGAECAFRPHMWSHGWSYSEWPSSGGEPYRTNDPAAGGGYLLIEDYIVAPALSCGGEEINEIGVFCHEIGHALGLPDLYDPNGGSNGIGYWGLMGTGNWNTPSSPAHLCGWSKEQLGWVETIEIDWRAQEIDLGPVQQDGRVVKIDLPYTRFRRREAPYPPGGSALVCGYDEDDAGAREWYEPGYGNCWRESMIRSFTGDGSGPITLTYDVIIDAEIDYDFGYLILETGSIVETLAVYNGAAWLTGESVVISDFLPPGARTFTLRALFDSDDTESNEDGFFDATYEPAFAIDNVSVTGGGISYVCDFEEDAGGWRADSPPAEYFLVENRRPAGFDINLPGSGLLIWHAENSIAYGLFGNSGGYTDRQARGLVLEEADGNFNLIEGDNMGDGGDPFPGSSGNRAFGATTFPSSRSNGDWITPVEITSIGGGFRVSARYRGGMPSPAVASVNPDRFDRAVDTAAVIDIAGTGFLYGATCALSRNGETVHAGSVEWRGENRLIASFPIAELLAGGWYLTVVSGDGQAVTAPSPITIESAFESASVTAGRDHLAVVWELSRTDGIQSGRLFRAKGGGSYELITDGLVPDQDGVVRYEDFAVLPETDYAYRIVTIMDGGGEEQLDLLGPYRIPDVGFIADTNFPNPFNGGTTISFFVPRRMSVRIDVYDAAGRLVHSWGTWTYDRGTKRLDWTPDAGRIGSGVYFCVFTSESAQRVVKMVLIR